MFDKMYSLSLLFSHVLFFYGLIKYNKKLLDILHVYVFISVLLSIFLENRALIKLLLLFTVIIQVLWIIEGRCILNEIGETSGMSKTQSFGTLLINNYLALKL